MYKDDTKQNATANLTQYVTDLSAKGTDGLKVIDNTTITLAGQTASKLVVDITNPEDGKPLKYTIYVLENNGDAIVLSTLIYHANETESTNALLDNVLQSFRFN
jgi:hypothetical protein